MYVYIHIYPHCAVSPQDPVGASYLYSDTRLPCNLELVLKTTCLFPAHFKGKEIPPIIKLLFIHLKCLSINGTMYVFLVYF